MITNLRHKNLIGKAIQDIKNTRDCIENNMPIDIVAVYIKEILEDLGNITGEFVYKKSF